jgi:hypothetical protein
MEGQIKTGSIRRFIAGIIGLAAILSAPLLISSPGIASETSTPGIRGGEIPIPFKDANLRVELSSGELYVLRGSVHIYGNVPFFEIDLDQHGWLASAIRMRNPYYVLEGELDEWKRYEGQSLRVYVRAIGKIFRRHQQLFYGIWLQSLSDPTPIELASRP